MSANVIIFDAQYTSEHVRNLTRAQNLLDEAVSTLKRASAHEGWKCVEVRYISDSMDKMTDKLNKLSQGVTSTVQVLTKGAERFSQLEANALNQANYLSSNLNNRHGFNITRRGTTNTSNAPIMQVPTNTGFNPVQLIKNFTKTAIKLECAWLGGLIGGVGKGVKGIFSGIVDDVKEGIIDKCVNIYQSSYNLRATLAEPPYDDTAREFLNIGVNAISLIATVKGLGDEAELLKNVSSLSDNTQFLTVLQDKVINFANDVMDNNKMIEAEYNGDDLVKILGEAFVPFGLDETLKQGLGGIAGGASEGAKAGYDLADNIFNFLGW